MFNFEITAMLKCTFTVLSMKEFSFTASHHWFYMQKLIFISKTSDEMYVSSFSAAMANLLDLNLNSHC